MADTWFQKAIQQFDEVNSQDPNSEVVGGISRPRELVYAERLSAWVLKLAPNASEVLQLAARCQHIARWSIPRNAYEMTRPGYLKWKTELKKFHAQRAGELLREVGYPEDVVAKVQALNLKKNFPGDPEARVLEDALCLVFLQYQLTDLASRTDDDKMVNALKKSWAKMSPAGRDAALKLDYTAKEQELLKKALAGT